MKALKYFYKILNRKEQQRKYDKPIDVLEF